MDTNTKITIIGVVITSIGVVIAFMQYKKSKPLVQNKNTLDLENSRRNNVSQKGQESSNTASLKTSDDNTINQE